MTNELRKKIKNLSPIFRSYSSIKAVYLFGSYVHEKEIFNSDIDIALLIENKGNFEDKAFLAYKLEEKLGFIASVDLIVLNK